MPRVLLSLIVLFLLSVPALAYPNPLTCTRNFYVATTGTDNSTCGASGSPCATPMGADAATSIGGTGAPLTGGDCVNVAAGTYNAAGVQFNTSGTSNQANGYITYLGAPNHASKIVSNVTSGFGGFMLNFVNNYVAFVGFEIDGHNIQGFSGTYNPNTSYTYNAYGSIMYPRGPTHHHMWLNNIVHGTGGTTIGSVSQDYELIAGNEIYDFSGNNGCSTSGISLYENTAIPNFTPSLPWDTQTYHFQILDNIVHDGGLLPNLDGECGNQRTDGNGIIIDDFQDAQNPPHVPYPYNVLVAGNVVWDIGGRGIEEQSSTNIFVANNTVYKTCMDSTVANCAGLEILGNNDAGTTGNWINNISIRPTGESSGTYAMRIDGGASAATHITNNLTYDLISGGNSLGVFSTGNDSGVAATIVANNKMGTNPTLTNLASHDFHPLAGSPVLGTGIALPSGVLPGPVTQTVDGFTQPSPPNIGTYILAGSGGTTVPMSVNSGGPAASPFVADTDFTAGSTIQNGTGTTDLSGCTGKCAPNAVYQTERYSPSAGASFSYMFPGLTVGTNYLVRLHFSEDWAADEVVGGRLEDVSINGVNVLSSFDIYHTAGNVAHKAVVQDFTKTPDSSGNMTVAFVAHAGSPDQYAKVDGIEILSAAAPTLQTLTLSSNTMHTCAAQGTLIGNISSTTAGSTVTIGTQSTANALQVAQVGGVWQLQVGSGALCGAHTYTLSLAETLTGATGSPKTTSGLSVTETCP